MYVLVRGTKIVHVMFYSIYVAAIYITKIEDMLLLLTKLCCLLGSLEYSQQSVYQGGSEYLRGLGEIVAARFSQDSQWYRARVIEVNNDKVKVSWGGGQGYQEGCEYL